MPKIIQLVSQKTEWLTALCDDGSVWEICWDEQTGKWDQWHRLPDLPSETSNLPGPVYS